MGAPSAAPGAGYTRAADRQGNAAGHRDESIAHLGLSAHVLETLADAGVSSLGDWKRLGPRRRQIFGITGRVIALLDRAANRVRQ